MGAAGHAAGQTGQLCHLDAVAVIGGAAHDAPQEGDVLAALFDRNIVVFYALHGAFQLGQLVVVGGEQGLAAQPLGGVCDMLHHGAGNAHAVKGRGAAADLVQHHKTFGGGIFQDLRHLGHLHHKGGLACGKVVRCADAGENSVHHTHMAAGCRHKGADLRHQGDKGILTHIGGFTSHIGAGDDKAAVGGAVEGGIVWHEHTALEHLLHHRVTPLGDGQHIAVVHHGAAVVVFRSHLRQRSQHIQLGNGVGGALDTIQLCTDAFQQFVKQAAFQRDEPLVCAKDLAFQLLQLLCDVTLAGGEGLLADVGLRHKVLVGVAYLNKVAKHMVIADLQLRDAGLLPQTGFQLRQHALGVIADGAQLIHLGMVTLGDDAAILEGGGRVRVYCGINARLDILQRVDAGGQLGKLRAVAALRLLAQAGQTVAGLGKGIDLLGGGRAVHRAGHQALQIRDVVQFLGQIAAHHGLAHQRLHGVQAVVDKLAGNERLLDPAAQHPLAHGGAGLIQHPKQGAALFAPPQGLGQLKVCPGDRRKPHELGFVVSNDGL